MSLILNIGRVNLASSLLLVTITLVIHSISWSNSRLPWRNPNPSARLNPKVENNRQQARIKEWDKIVKTHLKNNQPEKALKFLKETLRLDARNHYSLGMTSYLLLTYQKDFEAAKKMAIDGLNDNPQSLYCLHALAWLHYKQKEYGLAQRVIREIKQPKYAWFELQFHSAMIHWKAHNRNVARQHFLLARKLNPSNIPLWISLAMFMEEENDNNAAIKAYQKALELTDNVDPVRNYLMTKIDTLLPLYEPRQKLSDDFVSIHENKYLKTTQNHKKILEINKKKYNSSEKLKAENLNSKSWGRLEEDKNPFLFPLSEDLSKFQKKTKDLEQLSLEQHYQLGKELLEIGIREEAISQFETVINLWSNSEYTLAANTALKDAKNLGFQTYDLRIEKLFNYGTSLFDQKRFKECLHIQRKILLIQPKNLTALKNTAFLYLKFKRPITALKLLDKALTVKPNYSEALVLKAYGLASLRRFTNAADIISEVMKNSNTGFHKDYAQELQRTINRYQKPFDQLK